MANAYRHKRYFRLRNDDSSLATFTDVDNAKTKIGFRSAFDTSSPTTTFALADSDTTLIVTYEFDNLEVSVPAGPEQPQSSANWKVNGGLQIRTTPPDGDAS